MATEHEQRDRNRAELDAILESIDAELGLLTELRRRRRLAAGLPVRRKLTVEEVRAEAARLRAENDAVEVERIARSSGD